MKSPFLFRNVFALLVVTPLALALSYVAILFVNNIEPLFIAFPYALGAIVLFGWALHLPHWVSLSTALALGLLQFPVYGMVLARARAKNTDWLWITVLVLIHIITALTALFAASMVGFH